VSEFQVIEAEANAGTLEDESVELLEAVLEEWSPVEGGLLTWLVKAWSRIGATFVDQASAMSRAAFKRFGEAVVAVPPIQAAPATVESVWTMVGAAGYTIPVGTQVSIEASGDSAVGFLTAEEVTVAPAATKASILLRAVEPGTGGNGLSADPQLLDSLAFVQSIELEGVSSGGVDEEEEDAYLDRLVEELRTLSLSLIIGRDFEIDARALAGIARSKCIEAYNAKEGKEEALAVSVFGIDSAGLDIATPKKEELEARQTAKLLSGINYYVGSPTYTTIKGKTKVEVETGFDPGVVKASVEAFWAENFSPARWGLPQQGDSGSGWINQTKVYRLKVIGQIERISGVARVISFEHAKNEGALGTSEELTLEGVAPLTKPGTLTVETT
jgi:Baseplate J-like protein